MNTNDVNTYLLQAAKACVDQENHKGAIVAGYFAADEDAHNGVMVAGTPWDVTVAIANIIDKTAVQTGIPHQDILRAVRKIIRNVQRQRLRQEPGTELFTTVTVDTEHTEEE